MILLSPQNVVVVVVVVVTNVSHFVVLRNEWIAVTRKEEFLSDVRIRHSSRLFQRCRLTGLDCKSLHGAETNLRNDSISG